MPLAPQAFADAWPWQQRTAVLWLPSAVNLESPYLLLNPAHSTVSEARIADTRRFEFDPRLIASRLRRARHPTHA
jgi:RES domain-containing protein